MREEKEEGGRAWRGGVEISRKECEEALGKERECTVRPRSDEGCEIIPDRPAKVLPPPLLSFFSCLPLLTEETDTES